MSQVALHARSTSSIRRTLWRATTSLLAGGVALAAPALAAPTGPAHKLTADKLSAGPKEVQILAAADAGGAPGSAAIARVDRGGGAPTCFLLTFAGKLTAPESVASSERLTVCPAYDKEKMPSELLRLPLFGRKSAWRIHLGGKRMDSMAGGVETRALWALYADLGDGAGARVVFERTSTSFNGSKDSASNIAERCTAPVIDGASDPAKLSISCDTMTMFGDSAKKKQVTFRYGWTGERFELEGQ